MVTNKLQFPVTARCIRIAPSKWQNKVSMRVDLLGCLHQTTVSPSGNGSTAAPMTPTTMAQQTVFLPGIQIYRRLARIEGISVCTMLQIFCYKIARLQMFCHKIARMLQSYYVMALLSSLSFQRHNGFHERTQILVTSMCSPAVQETAYRAAQSCRRLHTGRPKDLNQKIQTSFLNMLYNE